MTTNACTIEGVTAPSREISIAQLASLARREREVLHLLSTGRPYKQIASELELSIGTVRTYVRRLYAKLRVNCRTEAVVKYLTQQLDN